MKRSIKLEDFPGFELVTLAQNYGWDKVVERSHPVYEGLVWEFYANFNSEIDTSKSKHQHQTLMRDKWIIFSPEVKHGRCYLGERMLGHYRLISGIRLSLYLQ